MAKKQMMSAKAKRVLKVLIMVWAVLFVALVAKIGTGETTRTIKDYETVEKTLRLPDGEPDEEWQGYRQGFIAAGYITPKAVPVGSTTIPEGTQIGKEQFDLLVEHRYDQPLSLKDPAPLHALVKQGFHVIEDIASKRPDYKGELLVKEGSRVTYKYMQALVAHGWVGEQIKVKGEDKIVGINLALPFVMINFLFLVGILYGLLWEPLLKVLDDRAEKIRTDLETAESERTEADKLKTQLDEQLAKIGQEKAVILERGKKEGFAERERIIHEARAEANTIVASAKAEIDAATQKAKKELLAQISQYSTTIAGEILKREIQPDDHRAMVDGFVAKLEQTQLN